MANSPTLFEAVLNANLSGIDQMKQRNYSRAISIFRKGLRAIQNASRHAMTCTTEMKKDTRISLDNSMNVLQDSIGFQVDQLGNSQHDVRPIQSTAILEENAIIGNDSAFLLFDRALMISAEYMNFIEQSTLVQDLASAVLIYNMGLAYHLEGLRTGISQQLQQAIRFYNMSYCLLLCDDNDDDEAENDDDFAALPKMALVNNTGHIHACFCSYYETSICSQDLLTYYHDQCYEGLPLSDEESAIFIKNCICFLDWQYVAAPAA